MLVSFLSLLITREGYPMANKILVVANSSTYEADAFEEVNKILVAKGVETYIFRQDRCLIDDSLIFEVRNGRPKFFVKIGESKYDVDAFSAIWYMHPFLPRELLLFEPAEFRQFINVQFGQMRQALWTLFQGKRWINDPWQVYRLENKIYQTQIASNVGLELPDTLITSDPEQVRRFYNEHDGKIIVKSFATSPIPDKVIMTNMVSADDYSMLESAKFSPAIYQEYVGKSYELRITVVGEKIFVADIFSQEDAQTAIDWRSKPILNDFRVLMKPGRIPVLLEEKIRHFMATAGLRYGCIDMIATKDGRYVFLEVNPAGQWYFVQLETGAQIAGAIAELLL